MPRVTVLFDKKEKNKLEHLKRNTNLSINSLVNKAIREYILGNVDFLSDRISKKKHNCP